MKHAIALALVLIICFSCIGCNSAGKQLNAPEEIAINDLLADLDNQAKAELNIGKASTLFVTIKTIYSDYCVVSHQFRDSSSHIYMDKELLAQLKTGEYMALSGVVDSVATNENSFYYVFKDGRVADIALFDAYVASEHQRGLLDNDHIYDRHSLLQAYANARKEALALNGEEIKTFLVGTWERQVTHTIGRYTDPTKYMVTYYPDTTFSADGTYVTQYYSSNISYRDYLSDKYSQDNGTWVIENDSLKLDGYFDSSYDRAHPVYKISSDVFIHDGQLFVRCP